MQKTDLNKFHSVPIDNSSKRTEGEFGRTAGPTVKAVGTMVWKTIKTILIIVMLTGLIVFISVASFIWSFKDTAPPDITVMSLKYSSFIRTENKETGEFEKYLTLHSNENRVWVDYEDIPENMKNAIVAIEDKRFYEHKGVDWYTTLAAVQELVGGGNGRGGSTLTQQLIKNMTEKDDVSIMRKVREIFSALNLEKDTSKDIIIEAYLNKVSFGGGVNGVQAAANLYFGKNIQDCDIAECAAIAGITQYPYLYNPLDYPEKNKQRRELVIDEMHKQERITDAEFNEAMEKSANMTFVGYQSEDEQATSATLEVWNWYIETMIDEVVDDLHTQLGYSKEVARSTLYNAGYEIYCAMDLDVQRGVENLFMDQESGLQPNDMEIQYGVYAMDYTGKTIAVVGSRQKKTGNMVLNFATVPRSTGSSIKPLSVYGAGLENGAITYGSVLKDQKIENYYGDGTAGPQNFDLRNEGYMNVPKAIRKSQNMPAAQLVNDMGVEKSFDFLTNNLHFKYLEREHDMGLASMALGGFYKGATVQEMTAGFQIFGSGGVYNKPYTYYYVKNHDGDVILDNRTTEGEQAMSAENAAIMNDLLHGPVYGDEGTAHLVQMEGVDMFGKTGTTDSTYDLTFFGGTPFCVAGVWNGYADRQVALDDSDTAKVMWRGLIEYLYNHTNIPNVESGYFISDNVVEKTYCQNSGLIAGSNCYNTARGLYANTEYGYPDVCNGGSDHVHGSRRSSSSSSYDDDDEIYNQPSESSYAPPPSSSESSIPPESSLPDNSGYPEEPTSDPDTSDPTSSVPEPPIETETPPPDNTEEPPDNSGPDTDDGGGAVETFEPDIPDVE